MIWRLSSIIFNLVIDQDKFEIKVKNHLQDKLASHINKEHKDSIPEEIKNIKDSCFENIDKDEIENAKKEALFILKLADSFYSEKNTDIFINLNQIIIEISIKLLDTDVFHLSQILMIKNLDLLDDFNVYISNSSLNYNYYKKWAKYINLKDYQILSEAKPIELLMKFSKIIGLENSLKNNLFKLFIISIVKNINLRKENKYRLIDNLLQFFSIKMDKDSLEYGTINLNILKYLLDELSTDEISIFADYLNELQYLSSRDNQEFIYLTLSVYIYYLKFFKKDLNPEYKDKLDELNSGFNIINKQNHSFKKFKFPEKLKIYEDIFAFYPAVNNILRKYQWEKQIYLNFNVFSDAKRKLPFITLKFFTYYFFEMSQYNFIKQKIAFEKNVSLNDISKLLNVLYKANGQVRRKTVIDYRHFKKMYGKNVDSCKELKLKSRDFHQYLIKTYKKKYKEERNTLNSDKINSCTGQFERLLKKKIINSSLFKLSNCDSEFELLKEDSNLGNFTKEILTEEYNMDDFIENYKQVFINRFVNKIKRNFSDSVLIDQYSENIISLIEKIKEYNIDSVIYSKLIEDHISQYKFNNKKYNELTENLEKTMINYGVNLYYNKNKLKFCIDNLNIKVQSYSDEKIKKMYNKKPGITAGNVFIKMDEQEYYEYIKSHNLKIGVSYEYYIDIKDDEGFYAEFEY